jgi:biopolymer transport protein ExbB/TolQ
MTIVWMLLKRFAPQLILIAAVLLAMFLIYNQGVKHEHERGQRALLEIAMQYQTKVDEANQRADKSAADFEKWKRLNRPKADRVTRDTNEAINANRKWADESLPDGVRNALSAAAPVLGAGEPVGTVPVAPSPSPVN